MWVMRVHSTHTHALVVRTSHLRSRHCRRCSFSRCRRLPALLVDNRADPGKARLQVAWQTVIRPRLDAVHRHMLQSRGPALFLQRLGLLHMLLSNVLAVAQHEEYIRGGSSSSSSSSSSVLPAARKYQQFMLGSEQLRRRLERTLSDLLPPQTAAAGPMCSAPTQQHDQQQPARKPVDPDLYQACAALLQRLDPHCRLGAGDGPGSMAWLAALEADHPSRQQLQQAQRLEQELLAQLDQLLAGSQGSLLVQASLAPVDPSPSTGGGNTSCPQEQRHTSLQGYDSDAEAGVTYHPDASWQGPPAGSPRTQATTITTASSSSSNSSSAGVYSSGAGGATALGGITPTAAAAAASPPQAAATAAAAAAGGGLGSSSGPPPAAPLQVLSVPRSRAALASLLRHSADPLLQQQLYVRGLCPLASAASNLLARVYRARAQQASLLGDANLAAALGQQQLCGDPAAVADFLMDLAAALAPAADAEVQRVLVGRCQLPQQQEGHGQQQQEGQGQQEQDQQQEGQQEDQQQQGWLAGGDGTLSEWGGVADVGQKVETPSEATATRQQQQQQQQRLEDTSQDTATFSSPAGSAAAPAADPWEWEYRYAQYLNATAPEPAPSDLEPYTTLAGVMAGWSSLLQQMGGVVLVPLALGGCSSSNPSLTLSTNSSSSTSSSSTSSSSSSSSSKEPATHMVTPDVWALDVWLGSPGVPWAPHVSAYSVLGVSSGPGVTQCHILGTIYLDWGGSYGCRVLQHSIAEQEEHPGDVAAGGRPSGTNSSSCNSEDRNNTRQTNTNSSSSSSITNNSRHSAHGRPLSQQLSQQVMDMACSPTAAVAAPVVLDLETLQKLRECSGGLPAVSIGLSAMPRPLQHGCHIVLEQQQQQGVEGMQNGAAGGQVGGEARSSASGGGGVLSCRLLWELGHELGHALHLVMSGRQRYSILSGRHLPRDLLELPSQIMERLLLSHDALSLVCRHHVTGTPLPSATALAVSRYLGLRYNSPLAVQDRTCAALAEQLLSMYSEESDQEDFWGGAFQEWSAVAVTGGVAATGRQLALLPVVAHHQGTYWSYLHCWLVAAQLWQHSIQYAVAQVVEQLGQKPTQPGPPDNHHHHHHHQQQQQKGGRPPQELQQVQKEQAGTRPTAPSPAVAGTALVHPQGTQPLRQVLLLNAGMTHQQLLRQLADWGSPLAAALMGEEEQAQRLKQDVQQGISSWLTQV